MTAQEAYARGYAAGVVSAKRSIEELIGTLSLRAASAEYQADVFADSATSEPVMASTYNEATMR